MQNGSKLILWIKVIHIISVISWMVGLLYLPRLFVYHSEVESGSESSALFKIMEKRLLRIIMNPAMISSIITGIILVVPIYKDIYLTYWLGMKILLVIMLCGVHMAMARWFKAFELDKNIHSAKFFRILNEAPTVLMIFIIILVVTKLF